MWFYEYEYQTLFHFKAFADLALTLRWCDVVYVLLFVAFTPRWHEQDKVFKFLLHFAVRIWSYTLAALCWCTYQNSDFYTMVHLPNRWLITCVYVPPEPVAFHSYVLWTYRTDDFSYVVVYLPNWWLFIFGFVHLMNRWLLMRREEFSLLLK